MNNDWTPKEYNKLADTDYKMEEYVRVPKEKYKDCIGTTTNGERVINYTNHQTQHRLYTTEDINKIIKQKQELKEWLEEEILKAKNSRNGEYESDIKYHLLKQVLERLGE